MYVIGVNSRLCVLMDEMVCFVFYRFLMLMATCRTAWVVYCFLAFPCGHTGRILTSYSLLISF